MHHPCRASTTLEARLGNPSPTCFQAKQAAKSRRVSNVVFIHLSVLWGNRQTIAHLVLRPKLRNHRGDFVGQVTKSHLSVLRSKPGNPSTFVLRPNQETHEPSLLLYGADRTQRRPTSQSSGHQVPDLCLIILDPLHQVSYSCHDPRRCSPCRTYHLHTMR
jgi:hypothetical protein